MVRPDLGSHVYPGLPRIGTRQRDPLRPVAAEPNVNDPAHRFTAPHPARVACLVQNLGLGIATPGDCDGQRIDAPHDDERQPHRRRPHPARVLHRQQVRQLPVPGVAARRQLGVHRIPGRLPGRVRIMPRPQPPGQVPLTRPWSAGRERLQLAVPGPEQVTLDKADQFVAHLVRRPAGELLGGVERRDRRGRVVSRITGRRCAVRRFCHRRLPQWPVPLVRTHRSDTRRHRDRMTFHRYRTDGLPAVTRTKAPAG